MTVKNAFAVILVSIGLAAISGCGSGYSRQAGPPATAEELAKFRQAYYSHDCVTEGRWAAEDIEGINPKLFMRATSEVPLDEAAAFYADRTQVSYDMYIGKTHGTQIEYTTADGQAHLWYPGNRRILHGRWKVEKDGAKTVVCFAYNTNGINPLTGHQGPDFECGPVHNQRYWVMDAVPGDLFNLANSNIVLKPLAKDAVKPYMPRCLPFKIPYLTDGKSPLEHLAEDLKGSLR